MKCYKYNVLTIPKGDEMSDAQVEEILSGSTHHGDIEVVVLQDSKTYHQTMKVCVKDE